MTPLQVLLVNTAKRAPIGPLYGDSSLNVTTITEPWYVPMYPDGADVRLVQDLTDLAEVQSLALQVLRETGIDRVVAPTERSLPTGAYLRSTLGLPGVSFEVANRFSNKYVMKRVLAAAGIRVADFRSPASFTSIPELADELGYPVVVKPSIGTGGKHTYVCQDRFQLEELLADARGEALASRSCRLLVERFVEMEAEYHADGIVDDGQTMFLAVSRYFAPLLGGIGDFNGSYVLPAGHPDQAPVRALHQAVVSALGLADGVTHLELFRVESGFIVGEITCRPAGGGIPRGVQLATGVDLWRAFLDSSLGRAPAWHSDPTRRLIVNCHLPIRAGIVRRISTATELLALPDVVDVEVDVRPGASIANHFNSSSTTGIVYLSVATEADVSIRLAEIAQRFVLEVETEEVVV
jgi:biotin carboxylase